MEGVFLLTTNHYLHVSTCIECKISHYAKSVPVTIRRLHQGRYTDIVSAPSPPITLYPTRCLSAPPPPTGVTFPLLYFPNYRGLENDVFPTGKNGFPFPEGGKDKNGGFTPPRFSRLDGWILGYHVAHNCLSNTRVNTVLLTWEAPVVYPTVFLHHALIFVDHHGSEEQEDRDKERG